MNAQEDPYSALEDMDVCKLDLLKLAQVNGEASQAISTSSSLYLHPVKARVQELKVEPGCSLKFYCGS